MACIGSSPPLPMHSFLRPRALLVSAALLLSSLCCLALDLSMTPGSASMPPKPLESPLPAGNRNFKPTRLGAWVDETGKVTKVEILRHGNAATPSQGSTDEADPSVQALLKWRFEPVLWEGKPIPFRAEVLFSFTQFGMGFTMNPLPNFPVENHVEGEFGLIMPSLKVNPEVQIPLEEVSSRSTVDSGFRFVVGTDGIPTEIEILGASSGSALNAGLNALAGQVYRPGTIAGIPVRVAYKQVISVSSTSPVPDGLLGLKEGADPVYPYAQLLAGEAGSAKVKFRLQEDGTVASVEILEATHENFGLSLKACISFWLFTPEQAASRPERDYTHEFTTDTLPGGVARLAGLLRKGETISSSGAQLSGRPTRVSSSGLCFPQDMLDQPNDGKASIEFIIDKCGLAQLPRIVEASHPSFGWAAANWVGSMRFKPLLRAGVPTDLRVIFPISFKHPSPPAPSIEAAKTADSTPARPPSGS